MTIDLEEVEGFATNAKELAIFVEDDSDRRCVSRGVGVLDRFHRGKGAHATSCDEVVGRSFESRIGAGQVSINVQHHKGCLNWEAVDKFPRFAMSRICEGTPRARRTHAGDVLVHVRPVETKADAMECADDVEVAACRIAVKSDKDDVAKDSRDDNQPGV